MKILHLSENDGIEGAPRAAYRLHLGLRAIGEDSSMFVRQKVSSDNSVTGLRPSMSLLSRVRRRLLRGLIDKSFSKYRSSRPAISSVFIDDRTAYSSTVLAQMPDADVVTVHSIWGMLDPQGICAVAERAPVVLVLHDMISLTGGCQYDMDCGRFTGNCGRCPQLGSTDEEDLSRAVFLRKQAAFGRIDPTRLHVVCSSRWLADQAQKSALLGRFPVSVIPYGLETDFFTPYERAFARAVLQIPADKKVVLFVATDANYWLKGFDLVLQALEVAPPADEFVLVTAGWNCPQIAADLAHINLGYLRDQRVLALAYSAADVLVAPSRYEAMGQTVLEAMACGTPAVALATGGFKDSIRHGVNGLLVHEQTPSAFGEAVSAMLSNSELRNRMSVESRRIALEEYSLPVQAKRYSELYKALLQSQSSRS